MSVVQASQDQAVEASKALVASVRSPGFAEQVAAALPENVPAHRFVRATVTAVLANPDVALSDHASVLNALLRSAQDGLVPDGREAAIVVYKGKAQYLPMVGGLRKIAAEYGWTISAAVVYANDEFDYELGLDDRLVHRRTRPGAPRGDKVAVYAVGRHRDGRRQHVVMYADEIQKVRNVSRARDRGPWVDWEERMWEKTAARRLFKELALDPNDQRIVRVLNAEELEPGEAERMLYGPPAHARALPPAREPIEGEVTNGVHTDTPREQGDTATEAGGGQQAGGGEQSAAPAAAPDPEPVTQPVAEVKAPTIAQARKVVLAGGMNDGKTIGQVASEDGALTWMTWASRNLHTFPPETAAAIVVVMKHDVPDAYAAYMERKGGQS